MLKNCNVTQLTRTIWKVTRWTDEFQPRKSLFVTDPVSSFEPDDRFSCFSSESGLLQFRLDGKTVLAEHGTPFTLGFSIGAEDGIYGLGMHQDLPLNRRGTVCQMVQINGHTIAVPFLTSTAGYSILFDTCAYMSIGIDKPCTDRIVQNFTTEETAPNQIQVFADDAQTLTYYVILGDTMDQQIAGYRLLTGSSPLLPRWAYGFFQSREHYHTQQQLLAIAREFRSRHIPLDCIVQDWHYWGELGWNALKWDPAFYPDPRAMIQAVHDLDMKLMLSVWSAYGPESEICQKLQKNDMLLNLKDGTESPWGRVLDAYDPEAYELAWSYMKENLYDAGIDAWWLDSTEPALGHDTSLDLLDAKDSVCGSNRRILNSFALTVARNAYRHQRALEDGKRVCILTRSGYAGLQHAAAASWTGDIDATWDVFKRQIPALLSYSASGIPYSTTDIGGFFIKDYPGCEDGKTENPEYRELYTRWFWFGAFSPLFRSHGTSAPREMWFFGEPGTVYYDAQLAASRLRYALMPYLYSSAFQVYRGSDTLMRPLAMDFPADRKACSLSDTYLFGHSLLVHIVTDYQKRSASVYLPSGCGWYDFYTGRYYTGGQQVEVSAELDQTPLFAKAGSLILMTKPAECTARMDEKILDLHIYPGQDCSCSYYRDDGDNYSYESGRWAEIPFAWDDCKRTLSIGAPEGQPQHFDLSKTIELYLGSDLVRTLSYTGQPMTVRL